MATSMVVLQRRSSKGDVTRFGRQRRRRQIGCRVGGRRATTGVQRRPAEGDATRIRRRPNEELQAATAASALEVAVAPGDGVGVGGSSGGGRRPRDDGRLIWVMSAASALEAATASGDGLGTTAARTRCHLVAVVSGDFGTAASFDDGGSGGMATGKAMLMP